MPAALTATNILLAILAADATGAPDTASARLDAEFDSTVRPFLTAYCIDCHGGDSPEGELNLARFTTTRSAT